MRPPASGSVRKGRAPLSRKRAPPIVPASSLLLLCSSSSASNNYNKRVAAMSAGATLPFIRLDAAAGPPGPFASHAEAVVLLRQCLLGGAWLVWRSSPLDLTIYERRQGRPGSRREIGFDVHALPLCAVRSQLFQYGRKQFGSAKTTISKALAGLTGVSYTVNEELDPLQTAKVVMRPRKS